MGDAFGWMPMLMLSRMKWKLLGDGIGGKEIFEIIIRFEERRRGRRKMNSCHDD